MIRKLVTQNSGTEPDAEDLMQRALLAIYERLYKEPDFQLKSKFSTFLYGVARNLWLKEIRKKKSEFLLTEEQNMVSMANSSLEWELSEDDFAAQRHILFWESFEKLGKDCKALLRKFFEDIEPHTIASSLGITYGSYRVKKTRCVQKLSSIIEATPGYRKLSRN